MNTDIGFVLIKLSDTETYDIILQTIKDIQQDNPYRQAVIFNSYLEKTETYNIPIFHLSQCQFFKGKLFIFDLPSIILTNNFPNIEERIFYATDMPWSNSPATAYKEWKSLYNQTNLQVIAQSDELYSMYNTCWKKPIGISENFNYEQIKYFV